MFTICTKDNKLNNPSKDYLIIVNGQKCKCNKLIAEKISPIIERFNKENETDDSLFTLDISASDLSTYSLEALPVLVTKIFRGRIIELKEDNWAILNLIGERLEIQQIKNVVHQYLCFKEMIKLEKMLLYELNESNIMAKISEYELLIKKIPIKCIIHFIINICGKNYKTKEFNTNKFVIEIIKNVNEIVPDTYSHFLSFMYHRFILIYSNNVCDIEIYKSKEITSLIHYMFDEGLMKSINEKLKLKKNEIKIPTDLLKYFIEEDDFLVLSKEKELIKKNFAQIHSKGLFKENGIKNENIGKKDQFNYFLELIKNDDFDSFQKGIISSNFDINNKITNVISDRLSFINANEECSLIEFSAFFGSLKCFTYLFNMNASFNITKLSYFAVAGGNIDIIYICEREKCVFNTKTLEISIEYHKHKITKWLSETKQIKLNLKNLRNSVIFYNIWSTKYLIKKGINTDKMITFICESNNIILLACLETMLKNREMKMIHQKHQKTALNIAYVI